MTSHTPHLNTSSVSYPIMAVSLSSGLAEALGHMQRPVACPEDVRSRIAALRVPADDVPGVRMSTNWRTGSGPAAASSAPSVPPPTYGRGQAPRAGGGGGGWNTHGRSWNTGNHNQSHSQSQNHSQNHNPSYPRRPYADRATMPRFGNKSRADVTTDERMMDRIRDKMNKFSPLTYDATKTWLSQLLDSGETEFLHGFITLVFEKAASEVGLVVHYARLLNELRAAFPHLSTELQRIFAEFLAVFDVARTEEELGAAAYDAFVALRQRQKFRRGYAAFIAEFANLGALTTDDITRTCDIILAALVSAKATAEQQQLCEEYAECLKTLFRTCKTMLTSAATIGHVRDAYAPAPGLSNRARFALMDIVETAGV